MSEIRPLTLPDLPAANEIRQKAYPTMEDRSLAGQQRALERLAQQLEMPDVAQYGLFRGEKLIAVMKLFDFTMNFMGQIIPVGGLSGVAVDLAHKKQGAARELVAFCSQYYEERGYAFTTLYPFRPDFYRQMSYGFGSRVLVYRLRPDGLAADKTKARQLVHLPLTELEQLQACYQRVYEQTHGMMAHSPALFRLYHDNPHNHLVAYQPQGSVTGYLIYRFHKLTQDNILRQQLEVRELIYETPAALEALLAFLHIQADQVEEISLASADLALLYRLRDPRHRERRLFSPVNHQIASAGIGLMYKITSVQNLLFALREHDFGGGSLKLRLELANRLQPHLGGTSHIHFAGGRASLVAGSTADVRLTLDIADFSALVMGCVDLASLCRLGLATLSDLNYLAQVDKLFRLPHPPICLTPF